jgi:hypothetical protein
VSGVSRATGTGYWQCGCAFVCPRPGALPGCLATWVAYARQPAKRSKSLAQRLAAMLFVPEHPEDTSTGPIGRDVWLAWQQLDDSLRLLEKGTLKGFRDVLEDVAEAREQMECALHKRDRTPG